MSRAGFLKGNVAALALLCAGIAPAYAQEEMYPGQSVQVNPQAGGRVLLYPDGKHVRTVGPLLQPGQRMGSDQIVLHMPPKHRRVAHRVVKKPVQVATTEQQQTVVPPPPPPPPPPPRLAEQKPKPRRPVRTASTEPVPQASPAAPVPFSLTNQPLNYTASSNTATPAAPSSGTFSRRSQIIFAAGAPLPAPNALDAIRMLGGDLNSALQGGADRIQLQAFGGARSDKSSDARRLSLKRALAIRDILIQAGVPSTKIDVRAMGGADSGPPDRVDVYVRG